MADDQIRPESLLRNCGMLAMDAVTLGMFSKAAEREALELNLSMAFPDDWTVLLATMDRFDRASIQPASPYIKQMWAQGRCQAEEVMALHSICPAAFRDNPPAWVIGELAIVILPKLAEALP